MSVAEGLRARHRLAMTLDRSVGGGTERFLRALARGEVLGSRRADGRAAVPPLDHDDPADDVILPSSGEVRSWTWITEPQPHHPVSHPFAYALIQLDGASTTLPHVLDVGDPDVLHTGMRVQAEWRAERTGSITDIRAFVPEGGAVDPPKAGREPEAVHVVTDVDIAYDFEPGLVLSAFFRSLAERRIVGGRCPGCDAVYVPPRPRCARCGGGPMARVDLEGRGIVVSFAVVHLPVAGMDLDLPYAWAWIRLDGADVPFAHLLGEVDPHDVAVGQRVEAVWVPDDELSPSWECIRHFRPQP